MASPVKVGAEIAVNTVADATQWQQKITRLEGGGFVITWWDWADGGPEGGAKIKAQVYTADGAPVGAEFAVNVDTPGETTATDYQYEPEIAALDGGGFAVAWWSSDGDNGIRARTFAADGTPTSADDFAVSTMPGLYLFQGPRLAPLDAGGFVAAWWSPGENGGDIRARVFGPDGALTAEDFRVNTTTEGAQILPEIATLKGGGFVATWRSAEGASGEDIRARVFAADGTPAGDDFRVNTEIANGQYEQTVTALACGGFVVTWHTDEREVPLNVPAGPMDIRARVFAADGTPAGEEFAVNTATAGAQISPRVAALKNGGFVIVWEDGGLFDWQEGSLGVGGAGGDTSSIALKAQVFDGRGVKVGTEILVNTATESYQTKPQIAVLETGDFVVTWTDNSIGVGGATDDNDCEAVKAQAFTADGERIGSEFVVNTTIEWFQLQPEITPLDGANFAIAWLDSANQVDFDVKAQVFTIPDSGRLSANDVILQNAGNGQVLYANMVDGSFTAWGAVTGAMGDAGAWTAVATGDVNGAGGPEVLIQQQSTGSIYYVGLDAGTAAWGAVSTSLTAAWKLRAAADVTGDGCADAIVQNEADGTILFADMAGGAFKQWGVVTNSITADWRVIGAGDINGDCFADVVVRQQSTGTTLYVDMANGVFSGWGVITTNVTADWEAKAVADVTGDGFAEVIFQNTPGGGGVNPGTTFFADVRSGTVQWGVVTTSVTEDWVVQGAADVDLDGFDDVLFQNAENGATLYANMNGGGFSDWGVVAQNITADWHAV